MSVVIEGSSAAPEIHRSGEQLTEPQPGSLCCVSCGYAVSLVTIGALPECPNCHGREFRRASIFDRRPEVGASSVATPASAPEWLLEARAEIDQAGHYLAFDEGGAEYAVIRLQQGWTRIGRSGAADVRLDDATVSRRHTLIVLTESGELRALDDRSLNGLFVNGQRVDWAALGDGDELEIGCYRLHVLVA